MDMNMATALLVILSLCIAINAGVAVVLIMLVRKWRQLVKIVEAKVLKA